MNKEKKAAAARELFLSQYQGVLSTHSVDVAGYPFGSVVPYCLNTLGLPVILISTIAQHTKNILSDPRLSLLATPGDADDIQTVGRITYIGEAEKLDQNDTDSIERYYHYFPQSRDYHLTHDFNFYSLKPTRIRFIHGFGQIFWVEKEDFILANPFSLDEEEQMYNHMNRDHSDAIKHYCVLNGITLDNSTIPEMIGIDSEGFHLRIDSRIHRVLFNERVSTTTEVRKALVEMAKT